MMQQRRGLELAIVVVGAVCGGAVFAAQRPVPKFEVISIRTVERDRAPVTREAGFTPVRPGGGYVDPNTTVVPLIMFAYEVQQPDTRLLGLPTWAMTRYSVAAKAAADFPLLSAADNQEQVRLMVRQMLADRFRLQIHGETREETVLKMSIDPRGLRVEEVAAPEPPEEERLNMRVGDNGGRMIGRQATIARIGQGFGAFAKQKVIDETGWKGHYDFDIRWEPPSVPNAPPPSPRTGPEGLAMLMTTLKDNFGLQFSRETGPVQYWVVDHIEQPTEN
jgi:uncharacterized protein (TIGR03435 family)